MKHSDNPRPLGMTSAFWIGTALVATLSAALLYALGPYLSDVSFLIIVNERMFDGERLYLDVRDINPPFSIWLYSPYVLLQNLTGLSAYIWIGIGLTGCLAVALLLVDYLLREGLGVPAHRTGRIVLFIALVVLLIMPIQFAQREHFCTIAVLPWLFLLGARIETGFRPSLTLAVLIGVFGSALVILKPHYALGYGLPLLYLAWHRKDWRQLFPPEALTVALMVIGYWTIVYFAAPEFYTEMVPIVIEVYLLKFASTQALLLLVTVFYLPALLIAVLSMRASQRASAMAALLLVASMGFAVAFIWQGKGWSYQQLPAIITALSAAIYIIVRHEDALSRKRMRRLGPMLIVALISFTGAQTIIIYRTVRVPPEVHALTDHPSLFAISMDIGITAPSARQLKADWIDRDPSDILAVTALVGAKHATDQNAQKLQTIVDDWITQKRRKLLSLQPDVIIIDRHFEFWVDYVLSDAEISRELENYEPISTVGKVTYLIRSDFTSGS